MNRNFILGAALALAVAVSPAIATAQQTPAAAPAATTVAIPIEFSGLLFPQFIYGGPKGNGTRSANQFQLERAYLTAKAKIGDRTSVRLTSDIFRLGGNTGYTMRVKFAYVQYDYWTNGAGFMGTNAQVRLGMQQTVINETEESYWPRYVAKIATERAGFFSPADLGVSTTFTLPGNTGELFAEVANGPGYTSAENDRFKDYSLRLTLTPLGVTPQRALTIAPWYYKGRVTSAVDANQGRKRDRMGVFAGFKTPAFMVGGDLAQATNATETPGPTGLVTNDRSGTVVSAYTHLKPFAMRNPNGTKAWGILLRWDKVSGDDAYIPNGDFPVVEGKFLVAGLTHDVNSKLSWSLDWQQQSPDGVFAPGLDLRTYNLHVSAAF